MSNIEYNNFQNRNQVDKILNLLYDYLAENRKTEESNIFKNALITKIKKLRYNDKTKIQEYIFEQAQFKKGDDKMQLLELYSAINNEKNNYESNEYQNLDFDIIGGKISGKYKIRYAKVENIGNKRYIISIEGIKRQNSFISYKRKYNIEIIYNPRNGVIRYNDGYGRYRIATIDHKYETKFNINHNHLGIYNNINGTFYKKGIPVPIRIRHKGKNITLILKF